MDFELLLNEIAQNSERFTYTHSEVIAMVICLEETIPSDLSFNRHWKVVGLLKGLKKHGITHRMRGTIAKLIFKILDEQKQEKEDGNGLLSEF